MYDTIYRRQIGHELVYFVHYDGRRLEVSADLALALQRQGKAKIRTIETR